MIYSLAWYLKNVEQRWHQQVQLAASGAYLPYFPGYPAMKYIMPSIEHIILNLKNLHPIHSRATLHHETTAHHVLCDTLATLYASAHCVFSVDCPVTSLCFLYFHAVAHLLSSPLTSCNHSQTLHIVSAMKRGHCQMFALHNSTYFPLMQP